jgi:hypothetical protein
MIGAAGCTLTVGVAGRGLVGAARCTLTAEAAGCGLVGAGGVLGLCPRGLGFALTARALPLRFALRAHNLGFALATIK